MPGYLPPGPGPLPVKNPQSMFCAVQPAFRPIIFCWFHACSPSPGSTRLGLDRSLPQQDASSATTTVTVSARRSPSRQPGVGDEPSVVRRYDATNTAIMRAGRRRNIHHMKGLDCPAVAAGDPAEGRPSPRLAAGPRRAAIGAGSAYFRAPGWRARSRSTGAPDRPSRLPHPPPTCPRSPQATRPKAVLRIHWVTGRRTAFGGVRLGQLGPTFGRPSPASR